jgi:3-deoxy-manno-octulosonate cytidylyltransferase (CMP-KDO synthetase)
MSAFGFIPARMASSRFPGKPLAEIAGRPMLAWCYEGAVASELLDEVMICTCDLEIAEWAKAEGISCVMTSDEHVRATDRVVEAAAQTDAEYVVLIQGDEPLVVPAMIDAVLRPVLDGNAACTNLIRRIEDPAELATPNTVKVARDRAGRALYMARSEIPTTIHVGWDAVEAFKQVAIFGLTRERLLEFAELEPTPYELAESVDMMRYIEHGREILLVETSETLHAVDVPEDVSVVEQLLAAR